MGNCGSPANKSKCSCLKRQVEASRSRPGGGKRSDRKDFAYGPDRRLDDKVFRSHDPIVYVVDRPLLLEPLTGLTIQRHGAQRVQLGVRVRAGVHQPGAARVSLCFCPVLSRSHLCSSTSRSSGRDEASRSTSSSRARRAGVRLSLARSDHAQLEC